MKQRTFCMLKPDAVRNGYTSSILAELAHAGFDIVSHKEAHLSKRHVEGFYSVHAGKPFFEPLCEFMASGPVMLLVLEKENAISDLRTLMGATDSSKAAEGTLRRRFGNPAVVRENAIHGSDSEASAAAEIGYWFSGYELY